MTDPMELVTVQTGETRKRTLRRWMLTVQVGDVLQEASGTYRVVRGISYRSGVFSGVALAIKHCSWTGRGHTRLNFSDLRIRGFRPTGVRVKLDTEMDAWLDADIKARVARTPCVTCCEAKDMP